MLFLKRIFTWWNGSTFGTNWEIRRKGNKVGEDAYGNTYFEQKSDAYDGRLRRWVTYKGYADASRVPPEWHGWLHHTWDEVPSAETVPHKPWEKAHLPNLTGSADAYAPKGSIRRPDPSPRADYEAWSPE